jgi:hypothetical protein
MLRQTFLMTSETDAAREIDPARERCNPGQFANDAAFL